MYFVDKKKLNVFYNGENKLEGYWADALQKMVKIKVKNRFIYCKKR